MEILDVSGVESNDMIKQFVKLADQLCEILSGFGLSVKPYHDKNNLYFAQLSLELQKSQINHLQRYVEVCQETKEQGHDLRESGQLIWNMLKKLNLKSNVDIYSNLRASDVVEIYNNQNVQTFRNLNFFKICSYTIDELLSLPWWKLYHRDEVVSREIFAVGAGVFSGEITEMVSPVSRPHILEETASASRIKMILKVKAMSPLVSNYESPSVFVIEESSLIKSSLI